MKRNIVPKKKIIILSSLAGIIVIISVLLIFKSNKKDPYIAPVPSVIISKPVMGSVTES
ncbi:MAG: hypothetical protein HUK25_06940, partial [Treponema sp.]|nr:hypothetical protein [Treponema sp.]